MSTSGSDHVQTGAELLIKNLEAQGVEYIFGIPGAKIDKVFDAFAQAMEFHQVRASYAADRLAGYENYVVVGF